MNEIIEYRINCAKEIKQSKMYELFTQLNERGYNLNDIKKEFNQGLIVSGKKYYFDLSKNLERKLKN